MRNFVLAKHLKQILLTTLLSFSLTACFTAGPDYDAPTLPQAALTNINNVSISERDEKWWRLFDDPMLSKLIDATIENNLSIESADANVRAAYAIYADVNTNDNILQGSLDATYNDAEQLISGVFEQQTRINFANVGANLTWDIDLFGKLKRAQQAAKADALEAHYARLDLRTSLVAETALRYSDYLNALMRKEVAEKSIKSLTRTRGIIAARTEEGFSSQLDLSRVDADLFGLLATLPEREATAERARQALIVLTGNSIDINIPETRDLNETYPNLKHPVAIGEPSHLLSQRADVAQAEQKLIALTARIGVARADLYPNLSISGFLGFITSDAFRFNNNSTAWSIAPTLNWNVFDLQSIHAGIDVANARQQGALADFKQQTIQALSEVEVALSTYKSTQIRQQLLKQQFDASNHALTLAKEQLNEGAIDVLGLLDIRRTKLMAEDTLVQAKSSNFSAMIAIYLSFGGGTLPSSDANNHD